MTEYYSDYLIQQQVDYLATQSGGGSPHTHIGTGGIVVTESGTNIYIDGSGITGSGGTTLLEGTGGIVTEKVGDIWYVDGSGVSGGGGTSSTLSGVAGEDFVKYSSIYQSITDGKLYRSFNNGLAYQADSIGLAGAAGVSGTLVEIVFEGPMENPAWSWTAGMDLYVSSISGGLTETPPTTSGYFVKPVAQAITSTQVWVHPELGWRVDGVYDAITITAQVGPKGDTGLQGPASTVPGPQGSQGPQVTYISLTGVAGETLGQYDIVYQDWTDSGKYKKAICNDLNKADACGVVLQIGGISSGTSGEVAIWGYITYSGWSWVAGKNLFLSNILGTFTQDQPTTSGYYVKPLGRTPTTSGIWFNAELGWSI